MNCYSRVSSTLLSFLCLILLITGCSRNPVTGKREVMFMSESQEINLGKSSDPQIVAQYGLYEDQSIQAFINEKGKEMAAISHRPHLNYEFKVLDSPVVNAFAVPGGYVYFTRGILAHFNNEAEFAGVLGHEIGHVTARHSAKQYSKQMLGQVLFMGGVIFSEDFRNYAQEASTGMQLMFLKFGRDAESQSDMLGVDYSTQVGYDAHEMAGFFNTLNRMRESSGQSIPDFLSTHPNPADRFNNVNQMATEYQQQDSTKTNYTVNRDAYLNMIDGIVYGEDPRQGFVEDFNFYHPELKFKFPIPQNWKYQNSPTQFQMAPDDGKALMTLTLAQGASAQEAANTAIQNEELKVIERSATQVNGLPAYAILADVVQDVQQGQTAATTISLLSYFIQYNNLIYRITGVSKKEDFNTYFSSFQYTMKNFNKLTDSSKLNRMPDRLKIVTATRSATLQQLLSQQNMPTTLLDELALINGMELGNTLKAGEKFKVIVKNAQGQF